MLSIRISLGAETRKQLEDMRQSASRRGDIRTYKRVLAIGAMAEEQSVADIATVLQVSVEAIRLWVQAFLLHGVEGLQSQKPPGRPPKLLPSQRREVAEIREAGPQQAGFLGACWRSPMIQHLISVRYGVFYSVHYISQLLKNMGFSYQKARFISEHLDEEHRKAWLEQQWPAILHLAEEKQAAILFGDEASFPQWGTLSYTWAKKGQQPTSKTSGKRKAYKVFGLIEYFTGRFFYQGHAGRFNSDSYASFLRAVLSQTKQHLILIHDRARYHTSKAMQEFFAHHRDRITVFELPSYSPDYNPIEKLWKEIKKEGTHLHYFPTFDSLKDQVRKVLLQLTNTPKKVLSLFGFYEELAAA